MIITLLFYFLGALIGLFLGILSFIGQVIVPPDFHNSLIYFLTPMLRLSGYINFVALFEMIGWFFGSLYILILFLVVRWIWSHLPVIGRTHSLSITKKSGGETHSERFGSSTK